LISISLASDRRLRPGTEDRGIRCRSFSFHARAECAARRRRRRLGGRQIDHHLRRHVIRNAKAFYVFGDGRRLTGREVDDADAGLRHILRLPLRLPRLIDILLVRRHGKDDEAVVLRDQRLAAARRTDLCVRFQVADDELAVTVLRRQRVGEPDTVARQLRSLDRLPGIVDVVGDRFLTAVCAAQAGSPALQTMATKALPDSLCVLLAVPSDS
jgi:hypothetical protein